MAFCSAEIRKEWTPFGFQIGHPTPQLLNTNPDQGWTRQLKTTVSFHDPSPFILLWCCILSLQSGVTQKKGIGDGRKITCLAQIHETKERGSNRLETYEIADWWGEKWFDRNCVPFLLLRMSVYRFSQFNRYMLFHFDLWSQEKALTPFFLWYHRLRSI